MAMTLFMFLHHMHLRLLAERVRAATGQVERDGAAACLAQREARPAMPDERMMEQALFQVIVEIIELLHLCCLWRLR